LCVLHQMIKPDILLYLRKCLNLSLRDAQGNSPSLLQYHVPMDIQGMLQQQNVPQVEDITLAGCHIGATCGDADGSGSGSVAVSDADCGERIYI